MPFVRRKRGQVLVVHNRRSGEDVKQDVLHRFPAPAELESTLRADGWKRWCESMSRRHPDLSWDWPRMRDRLQRAQDAWAESPAGGAVRRMKRIQRLAVELERALATTSRATASETKLIEDVRGTLESLRSAMDRLLEPSTAPRHRPASPGGLRLLGGGLADQVVGAAMECWRRGDRDGARAQAERALTIQPDHLAASALLGRLAMIDGDPAMAERHLERAVRSTGTAEGEDHGEDHEAGGLWWSARYDLALLRRQQGKAEEAAQLLRQLLDADPARRHLVSVLLGEALQEVGHYDEAIELYEQAEDDPAACFNLALVCHQTPRPHAAEALLRGFAANRYVAPMLLGERWTRLDGDHLAPEAEPDLARDYARRMGPTWERDAQAMDFLALLWLEPCVVEWRGSLDMLSRNLANERSAAARRQLLESRESLVSALHLQRLAALAIEEPRWLEVEPGTPLADMFARVEREIPDEQRLAIGDTWVTDMSHYAEVDELEGREYAAAKRLAAYLGRVVSAASCWVVGVPLDSAIRCRRRPGRRPCPGHIRLVSEASSRSIHWGCTRCKDDGVISNWRSSRWDLDAEALDSLPAWPGLVMDHQTHAELLDGLSVDHPLYAPLARAIHHPDGVVVLAAEADLDRMRGLMGGIAEPDLPKEASAMELIVLGTGTTNARCRILGGEELLTLRSGSAGSLVPGEIVTLQPRKDWTYRRNRYVSGELDGARVDLASLRLTPLALELLGEWSPDEHSWGDEPIEPCLEAVRRGGPRSEYRMERIDPGDHDPTSDGPVLAAIEHHHSGDSLKAEKILHGMLATDLRCLDAHAHLGNFAFDMAPARALRHYAMGVGIAELSFPEDFSGVLPWGYISNRPFFRCLHGLGLCLWRCGRPEEAAAVFERMLWLNPTDNQGVRGLVPQVRRRLSWDEHQGA